MTKDVNDSIPNEESKALENSKPLFISVIIMGVLIVIGVVALIGVVAHRAFHHQTESKIAAYESVSVPAGTVARLSLPLKQALHEHITSIIPRRDGMIAIGLASSNGTERVLLWAPEHARLVAELDLTQDKDTQDKDTQDKDTQDKTK